MPSDASDSSRRDLDARRRFLAGAASGTVLSVLGGLYILGEPWVAEANASERSDGKKRVPPGQRVIRAWKPMGGRPGEAATSAFRLKISGHVARPFSLGFRELLEANPLTTAADVHCVTGWSVLGSKVRGVRLRDLAERAGVAPSAKHVILEAAHGYTANLRLADALKPNVMIIWELEGRRLEAAHGGPVRALVPDHYFWKSPKWLTGVRFSDHDEPGYWETRGYHNHADPWREERHA